MAENGSIFTDIHNHITTITFHHPKGNSLPGKLLRELAKTITEVGQDTEAHVIVLKSEGEGAFCAGASFDELMAISNYEEGKRFFMGFALVLNAMRTSSKLTLVRVQGKTVGGGVGIAAAGDYTFAHKSAAVKLSELALGIGPFVVGPAVERKVGSSAFGTMAIDATSWHDAGWSHSKGLFSRVLDSREALDEELNRLAEQLARSSPEAIKELKSVLWKGTDHWDKLLEKRAEISGRLVLSDYTKDFIQQFKKT